MTVKEAYSYSVQFLELNKVDEADFKALCTVCHLAGIKNSQYLAHQDDEIIMGRLGKMLWRLKTGEPLQYVIGKWDFYESEFYVGEGVLIPRPETEELVELAIDNIGDNSYKVIDLCAGSGCIGLSIAKACPNTNVTLIEKSELAYKYLEKNSIGVDNATIILGDIADDYDIEPVNIIVSNPPYIKTSDIPALQEEVLHEPEMALDGGADGLDFYRLINDKWALKLKENGILFLEIGNEQGEDMQNVLTNFRDIKVIKDLYGNDRMVKAIKG